MPAGAKPPGFPTGGGLEQEQAFWKNLKRERPGNIIVPQEGQESVWDYPRPPRVETESRLIKVIFAGKIVASSQAALRVLETSNPPTYYFPPDDIVLDFLAPTNSDTLCEWKGSARHWNLRVGDRHSELAGWSYPDPEHGFEQIRNYLAFYAFKVDECHVGDELAQPQPGDYYGGWVTSEIVGPFKGEPGSELW